MNKAENNLGSETTPAGTTMESVSLTMVDEFLDNRAGWRWFRWLLQHLHFRQEQIFLFGRRYQEPRLTAWFGPAYTYSGLRHPATAYPREMKVLLSMVQAHTRIDFNAVLVTLYRDGSDHVGWHADNEPELGTMPAIAVVSLGAPRHFCVKLQTQKKTLYKQKLTHGSLAIMPTGFQSIYHHKISKSSPPQGARISLSFRQLGSS